MIEGLCPSAHSLRPIRSSTPKIPLTPSCPEGTLRRVSLTPLLPLDTTISLLSPLFPLDTKMRGRVPPSIFPYFPVCTVHSSGYPPRFQLLARSYSKNRGRKGGGMITSWVTNQRMSARRHSLTNHVLRERREFTSMMGLGSWRIARTNAATSSGSNCVLAQRSTSASASSAVRPFL